MDRPDDRVPPAAPPGYARPAAAQQHQPVTALPLGDAPTTVPPVHQPAPAPFGYAYPQILPAPRRRLTPVLTILLALIVLAGAATALVVTAPHALAGGGASSAPATGPDLSDLLSEQMADFDAGDEAGYLATVAAGATDARAAFRRFYRNLHAIGITSIELTSPDTDTPVTGPTTVGIDVAYCPPDVDCFDKVTMRLRVAVAPRGDGVQITGYPPPGIEQRTASPLPWAWSDLTVVTGKQVIMAAGGDEAAQLSTVLPIAEAAAANADKYAVWGHPDRYLIYLASAEDSEFWYGGALDGSIGEAIPLTGDDIEVMVILPAAASTRGPGLDAVLAHELGHVVTLYESTIEVSRDSFTEGIADYIAFSAHPAGATDELDLAGTFLRGGSWTGHCQLTEEIHSHDPLTANAAYAIGYLCLKRMAERYGVRAMLNFWGDVKRGDIDIDQASRGRFHQPWAAVEADCVAYIHQVLDA